MRGSSDTRHIIGDNTKQSRVDVSIFQLLLDVRDAALTCSVMIILLADNPALNQSALHVLSPKSIQIATHL